MFDSFHLKSHTEELIRRLHELVTEFWRYGGSMRCSTPNPLEMKHYIIIRYNYLFLRSV